MLKIAVVTTFPSAAWDVYARTMLKSFHDNWPEIPIIIPLDEGPEKEVLRSAIPQLFGGAGKIMYPADSVVEQVEFLKRHKDRPVTKDFRSRYVQFSHKVFAIAQAMNFPDLDYLIWMDADIVTKEKVSWEDIKSYLPEGKMVSYLGRTDGWSSETGFLMFDLRLGAKELIKSWISLYLGDELLKHPDHTDAYAFDLVRQTYPQEAFHNLSEGVSGRDVFEFTILGKKMEHYKGPRKLRLYDENQKLGAPIAQVAPNMGIGSQPIALDKLHIKTKNCVDHATIQKNITENLKLIRKENWIPICQPNEEEIVICSAGPSLCIADILPWYQKGAKIIAVKHALERLLDAGIVPWACILLDPRPHVANFVEDPHPDIKYIVSSMSDPSVTRNLLKKKAQTFGYHAWVGANEMDLLPEGHLLLQGGSATATRGISVLEAMGFHKMHLYGYDCCYFQKPDLKALNEHGKIKHEEITLKTDTWGGEAVRTFWTEGQFLAQIQEFKHIYLKRKGLEVHTYGDGIIPWLHRHEKLHQQWLEHQEEKARKFLEAQPTVGDFFNALRSDRSIIPDQLSRAPRAV